jgi:hypothetical protein
MSNLPGFRRTFKLAASLVVLAALLLSIAGCTTQQGQGSGMTGNSAPVEQTAMGASGMKPASGMASKTVDPNAQTCSDCAGKGMAPMVEGTAATSGGVQTMAIGVKDGYYNPNQFKAQSGMPIKVVFTGSAAGCLGNPTFKSLGKKADFTKTGSATIDLGTLAPGTYEFACGMGMTGGKIVVQ